MFLNGHMVQLIIGKRCSQSSWCLVTPNQVGFVPSCDLDVWKFRVFLYREYREKSIGKGLIFSRIYIVKTI